MDTRRFNRPEDSFSYRSYVVDGGDGDEGEEEQKAEDRRTFYRTGLLSQAKGSAYVERGDCKVLCAVFGPRDIPKRSDFSMRGVLFCHVDRAPFAGERSHSRRLTASPEEREVSLAVQDALAATVRLELFPKSQLDVYVCVLDSGGRGGGDPTGAAVTAAGLALASGGIPMLDLLVGASSDELPAKGNSQGAAGSLTVGYLPHLEQMELLHFDGGLLSVSDAEAAIERLVEECGRDGGRARDCLLREAVAAGEGKKTTQKK